MLNRSVRVSTSVDEIRRATLINDASRRIAVLVEIALRASKERKNKHKRGYSHKAIPYLAPTVLPANAFSMAGRLCMHIAFRQISQTANSCDHRHATTELG
jgi:hypothetical protein